MRKALLTSGTGPLADCLALALPSFEAYATRHGYELVVGDGSIAGGRPAAWTKVAMLRQALTQFELALWLDADTMVIQPELDIAAELDTGHFQGLVRHRRAIGEMPNSGVWVLRAGEPAQCFLADVWGRRRLIHHPWWENAAILEALGYTLPRERPLRRRLGRAARALHRRPGAGAGATATLMAPPSTNPALAGTYWLDTAWNTVLDDPSPHPRILHWPGQPLEQRLTAMAAEAAKLRASQSPAP